jgi:hypothetical protein
MVELEKGDRPIELERDVLELHCFLMTCVYALFARQTGSAISAHI